MLRVTARDMSHQRGNWRFPYVLFKDAKVLAIVYFDTERGPRTHVGDLTTDVLYGKIAKLGHASSTYGFVEVIIDKDDRHNWFFPKISEVMQVTP